MKALIDADILSYEISSCGQFKDELTDEIVIRDFGSVSDLLDQKIKEICAEAFTDESPTLYLTGDEHLLKHVNRARKYDEQEAKVYNPNFRNALAKVKPYKGTRKAEKPFHFHNLRVYMLSQYDCVVTEGMEADDLICVELYKDYVKHHGLDHPIKVIACTRDKDLRMCPGLHFGWVCGKQPAFGPMLVDEFGSIELIRGSSVKIRGTGIKFFYSQLLTGDAVDNIPGLPKVGPVAAFGHLDGCKSEEECFKTIKALYRGYYGDDFYEEALREQVDLLWMVRELNEDGTLKFYEYPQEDSLSVDQEVKTQDVEVSGLRPSSVVS